jgi:hypothetical protein
MEGFFLVLFFAMIAGSIWGGVVLARKWVKDTLARVFLALVLIAVFIVVGTTAVFAGCSAVVGPPNFH